MISIEEKPRERIIQKAELKESKEYRQVEAEFKVLGKVVEDVLEHSRISRNNDNWLISKVWQRTGWATIEDDGLRLDIPINQIRKLPSPESITRCRRKIQNTENRLLPTAPEVLIKRKIREACIRDYFGADSYEYKEWRNQKFNIK